MAPSPKEKLGGLSSNFESSGNPGTVAADRGGNSYGTYQLSTLSGNAQKFADSYGGAFKGLKAGTAAFDKAWKAEATKNPTKFGNSQYDYMIGNHYTPAANAFTKASGIAIGDTSKALKEVVLSIGVQHGAGGAASVFKGAKITKGMSDKTIIEKLYAERRNVDKHFKSSDQQTKASVKKRFFEEEKKALAMIGDVGKAAVKTFGNLVSGKADKVASTAIKVGQSLIGKTTYKLGGGRNEKDIKNGIFDCSSFVQYALGKAGKKVGSTTAVLKTQGSAVSAKDMKVGDLVFFDTYKKDGHVGIYLGDNKFIGAQTSTGVDVVDMNDKYWKDRFSGNVRRV